MSESDEWSSQLDWLNIIEILDLESIHQIPELKKKKVIKKLSKLYGSEVLLSLTPNELDELVANELRDIMKKELITYARRKQQIENSVKRRMSPLKKGKIIGINMNDLKDIDPNADPEEIIRYFSKKLLGDNDEDDNDEDADKYDDDKDSYYI
jgi:hypothetical protein